MQSLFEIGGLTREILFDDVLFKEDKFNPQTEFFLGYSESLLDDDDLERMTTTDRTLFLKIGYAWIP